MPVKFWTLREWQRIKIQDFYFFLFCFCKVWGGVGVGQGEVSAREWEQLFSCINLIHIALRFQMNSEKWVKTHRIIKHFSRNISTKLC